MSPQEISDTMMYSGRERVRQKGLLALMRLKNNPEVDEAVVQYFKDKWNLE